MLLSLTADLTATNVMHAKLHLTTMIYFAKRQHVNGQR